MTYDEINTAQPQCSKININSLIKNTHKKHLFFVIRERTITSITKQRTMQTIVVVNSYKMLNMHD